MLVESGLREYARGCHVYKDIWEASIGEQLLRQRESGNCADPFAVAIGCQKGTLGSCAFDEILGLFYFGRASAFYSAPK